MKMVKTTGKAFRLYCQSYQKERKQKLLKSIPKKELIEKASQRWMNLDRKEKQRFFYLASHPKRGITAQKTVHARFGAAIKGGSRPGRPTTRGYRSVSRRTTPSKSKSISRSRSRSRSIYGSGTSFSTDTSGYGASTRTATSQTSQTSLTSCTSAGTYVTSCSDTSYDQYHDSLPDRDIEQPKVSPPNEVKPQVIKLPKAEKAKKVNSTKPNKSTAAKPKAKPKPKSSPAKKTGQRAATVVTAKPKKQWAALEKTAGFSRPRRYGQNIPTVPTV